MPEDLNWLVEPEKAKPLPLLPLYLGLGGLILLAAGFFIFTYHSQSAVQVEVISSPTETIQKIMVDLQGAVEKPGVYEMKTNDRVQDLLVHGGGLSAAADREWVSKNLNLALKLSDGAKIYIPAKSEVSIQNQVSSINNSKNTTNAVLGEQSALININNASLVQLDSLPGIGQARGQAIIDNRPYNSLDDLVTKKVLTKSIFEKIKDKITVY